MRLLLQLAKYKALLSESLKRQKLLELQVTQGLVYGTVSSEQLTQTNSDMAAVSARLQADQPIQVRLLCLTVIACDLIY